MNDPKFPAGWDADRVKRLVDHYESMSEDELAAEDEAAVEEKVVKFGRAQRGSTSHSAT